MKIENLWVVFEGTAKEHAPIHVDVSKHNANQTALEALQQDNDSGPYSLHEYVHTERYQHALDIIQRLLTTYGCKTKQWEEARILIDQERPLLKESKDE